MRKRMWVKIVSLFVVALAAAASGQMEDDFSVDHDYMTTGSVSFWDGYTANVGIQVDPDAVVSAVAASGGQLTITSTLSEQTYNLDDGPVLFTTVPAGVDFDAKVKVVGGSFSSLGGEVVYYNAGGLYARGTDANSVADYDFMCLEAFDQPDWNAVYLWCSNDAATESEQAIGPSSTLPITSLANYPWQRLTRVGDIYTAYASPDGITWTQLGDPFQRTDLTGQLEVGLHHCTFSDGVGTIIFDDFSIDYGPAPYNPVPKCRQGMVLTDPDNPLYNYVPGDQILSWSAPSDPNLDPEHTITYDVYMSSAEDPNILLVSDNQTATTYDPLPDPNLPIDTTYYWYVEATILRDDANDVSVVTSPKWSFRTRDSNLAPVANAGPDLYTWLDAGEEPDPNYITVTLNGSATDDGNPVGSTLSYRWTISATVPTGWWYAADVLYENQDAAVTKAYIPVYTEDVEYTFKLTVSEVHETELTKSDTDLAKVFVYSDSCEASRAKDSANIIFADSNYDCVLDLTDFLDFAQDWLRDTNIERPE